MFCFGVPAADASLKTLREEGTREREESIVADSAFEHRSAVDHPSLRKPSSSPVRLRSTQSHSESESYDMRGFLLGDAMRPLLRTDGRGRASTGRPLADRRRPVR